MIVVDHNAPYMILYFWPGNTRQSKNNVNTDIRETTDLRFDFFALKYFWSSFWEETNKRYELTIIKY